MTITLKSLTSADLTLNDYASIAADALAAINAINAAWSKSERAGGYAANFRTRPSIHEELELQLYEAITDFDCDPQGTLDELRFQNEPRESDLRHWPLPTDEEFDFATSRGLAA